MKKQKVIGRYALHERISSGGMATVYYGRLLGPVGFSRTVAIKQLHPQFSRDPDFVSMFVDEAHLAARIRHPNVVPVLDVVKSGRELYIVMDFVLGATLAEVISASARAREPMPFSVVSAIIGNCLRGLHAAHETMDDAGEFLGIVHRDMSPANVIVGKDGLARVLDFGIAKAGSRAQVTRHGELKGKVGYMAPEQMRSGDVDRRADVYSVAVTLWEALTRRRAFAGDAEDVFDMRRREEAVLPPPSRIDETLAPFDDVVSRGLARAPEDRYPTAEAFADALESVAAPAAIRDVSRFVARMVGDKVEERAKVAADLERVASPEEVRAAIRDEVGVTIDDSSPAISVSTWSDPSLDILALVESHDEKTMREVPSVRTEEEPPTSVVPVPPLESSAPISLKKELSPSTPQWESAKPMPAEKVSRGPSMVAVGGAILAMIALGAVALKVLSGEAVPVEPARTSRPEPEPVVSDPSPIPAPAPTPTVREAPRPVVSAKASAVTSSAPAPTPRRKKPPADPFDSLGGRH